jgi:YggT family protein
MSETLIYILKTVANLYATLLLIRFLLQLVRADFYNPISQTVLKLCAPVVEPLHRIFPTVGRVNTAALIAAILVKWLPYIMLVALSGMLSLSVFAYLLVAAFDLLRLLIEIYFWGIFILVIASWAGTVSHPSVNLVSQVIEPYMSPFRKVIPPIGMIDISPMAAIFTLMLIRAQLLPFLFGMILPLIQH